MNKAILVIFMFAAIPAVFAEDQPAVQPPAAQQPAAQAVEKQETPAAVKAEEIKPAQDISGAKIDIASRKEKLRLAAVEKLKESGTQEAVSILINALNDKSESVREEVIKALGVIKNHASDSPVGKALKEDKETKIRIAAAEYFGNIRSKDSITALESALADKDMKVRLAAIASLDAINAVETINVIGKALDDREKEVRLKALDALANTKSNLIIPQVKKALKDKEKQIRIRAIEILGGIKDHEALLALADSINDKDLELRMQTMNSLTTVGDKTVVPAISKAVNDPNIEMRMKAVVALSAIGDESVYKPLEEALDNDNAEVVKLAVEVLGVLKKSEAVAPLLRTLQITKDEDTRYMIIESLGKIGERSALPAIVRELSMVNKEKSDKAAKVRTAIESVITKLQAGK
jgi:HEAT repeat protein